MRTSTIMELNRSTTHAHIIGLDRTTAWRPSWPEMTSFQPSYQIFNPLAVMRTLSAIVCRLKLIIGGRIENYIARPDQMKREPVSNEIRKHRQLEQRTFVTRQDERESRAHPFHYQAHVTGHVTIFLWMAACDRRCDWSRLWSSCVHSNGKISWLGMWLEKWLDTSLDMSRGNHLNRALGHVTWLSTWPVVTGQCGHETGHDNMWSRGVVVYDLSIM